MTSRAFVAVGAMIDLNAVAAIVPPLGRLAGVVKTTFLLVGRAGLEPATEGL
jgi:hypothetical protein